MSDEKLVAAFEHGTLGPGEFTHETITLAYLFLIAERLEDGRELSWEESAALHPDLLAQEPPVLARCYTPETLQSDRARRVFVAPDRVG